MRCHFARSLNATHCRLRRLKTVSITLTTHAFGSILKSLVQLSVKSERGPKAARTSSLAGLRRGEHGILDRLELPDDQALRLLELGVLPGARIVAPHSAPGVHPRL